MTKSQIDKLGDRLRKGNITEEDLRLVDDFRRTYTEAYEEVVGIIRNELGLEPTGRPAKTVQSLTEKLKRESIRLTQIQDVAGCRIIVPAISDQFIVVHQLMSAFGDTSVVDRRTSPSHGYRAVHIIVRVLGKSVEVQVRTSLQHLWAEFSEKLSDLFGLEVKYGGGPDGVRIALDHMSRVVLSMEEIETANINYAQQLQSIDNIAPEEESQLTKLEEQFRENQRETEIQKEQISEIFENVIKYVMERKVRNDLLD